MEHKTSYSENTHELEANLHEDMPQEIKKMILNLNEAAVELAKFIENTLACDNEETNPENYVAFELLICYNDGKKTKVMRKRAMNITDLIVLRKHSIGELFNLLNKH